MNKRDFKKNNGKKIAWLISGMTFFFFFLVNPIMINTVQEAEAGAPPPPSCANVTDPTAIIGLGIKDGGGITNDENSTDMVRYSISATILPGTHRDPEYKLDVTGATSGRYAGSRNGTVITLETRELSVATSFKYERIWRVPYIRSGCITKINLVVQLFNSRSNRVIRSAPFSCDVGISTQGFYSLEGLHTIGVSINSGHNIVFAGGCKKTLVQRGEVWLNKEDR